MARVCIIRQYHYPLDPRVRREARALESLQHEVDVICIGRAGEPRRERRGRVTVYRLPLRRSRGGAIRQVLEYATFLLAAGCLVSVLHMRRRYALVQVNTMPDALVFAALGPRMLGARVLLDLHECMPEFLASKYDLGTRHPAVRLLALLEQASISFADRALTCTEQMKEAFIGRGARAEKIDVVLNAADEETFAAARHRSASPDPGQLVLVCHGSVEPLYGLDTVLRALALLRGERRRVALKIYGEGSVLGELRELACELELSDSVYFSGEFVPLPELVSAIAGAGAGVVANRRDVFRDLTHCNKMYDFIAMQKPVICSRTRSVEAYFDEGCFQYFNAGDEHDLARAIRELDEQPELAERLVRRATEVCEPYRWAHQRNLYQEAVTRAVCAGARSAPARSVSRADR